MTTDPRETFEDRPEPDLSPEIQRLVSLDDDGMLDNPTSGGSSPTLMAEIDAFRNRYRNVCKTLIEERDQQEEWIEAKLRYRLNEAETGLLEVRQHLEGLNDKLKDEKIARTAAEERVKALTTSTSWRLTAPLRKLSKTLKS